MARLAAKQVSPLQSHDADIIMRLTAGTTILGETGAASTVTMTLSGIKRDSTGAESAVFVQAQLPLTTPGVLYTSVAETAITSLSLANTNPTTPMSVTMFAAGSAGANQISGVISIPANGAAYLGPDGWRAVAGNGAPVT